MFSTIETDGSNVGFGRILKQNVENNILIVQYYSGTWNNTQINYLTIKKEILVIILCVQKFRDDVFNLYFLLRVNCKSNKELL